MPDNGVIDKRTLSEEDICRLFITPAIESSGWNPTTQIRQEVTFTDGKILVRGNSHSRGERNRADYILFYKENQPIAIVEAKDNNHGIGDGMQQAIKYGKMLDLPFVYSSNGDAFIEHDLTKEGGILEKELPLTAFPPPEELWRRYCEWKGLNPPPTTQAIVHQPYYADGSGKSPRYYQRVAINRAIEAIGKGQNRVLLVMATGTGKTYVAFQIIWRLWKSRTKKRILFLADRNILVDQTRTNDFKPFGKAMTKIRNRKVDKSYEIYLALYQAVSGTEDVQNIYKQFSKDFFDLIVIDECHRGSAEEDSAWREILDYFSGATHIGLTATPKETRYVSNIEYFGDPVYTYSLKQGIEDGFLAPFKVIKVTLDIDKDGWRPEPGQRDKYGEVIEDKEYTPADFDRTLVIDERTALVAKRISEHLKNTNRYDKTIVFCTDINHAERMRRALINENGDLFAENHHYIMRITGDNPEGKAKLDDFINPESRYPVIVTTSRLLSTGVDAQTCKLIVLDRRIQSLTEFKQIIGRGSRIKEAFGKAFFTIIDFKMATELFADPDFDGEPKSIYEGGGGKPPIPPGLPPTDPEPKPPRHKYHVNGVDVNIDAERVQYCGKDGKLITESLKDYTKKSVTRKYAKLEDFLTRWNSEATKQAIVRELEEQGVIFEALREEVGKAYDPFDLICHIVYDKPALTRTERAENVRDSDYFDKYEGDARKVLDALLVKYADEGLENLESLEALKLHPLNEFGTPLEIIGAFGGREVYLEAIAGLEAHLYAEP
jgi:type I restriction enzyme R subunit